MNRFEPMVLIVCCTAYCAPWPIASMMTTAPTPITMPSMVKPVRRRLAPMASQASPSIGRIMALMAAGQMIADDFAIEKAHLALGMRRDIRLVRDQHDGDAVRVEFSEQAHDFLAGMAVEIAGRLIGQNQPWCVDQCAGNRHALLLAAGNPVGQGFGILAQPDPVEQLARLRPPRFLVQAGINQRQGDVVLQAHARQQVEALKDETQRAVAQNGQRILVHLRDVAPGEKIIALTVGVSRQPSRFMKVDLPEPDGPMIARYSPGAMLRSTPAQGRKQAGGGGVGFAQADDPDDRLIICHIQRRIHRHGHQNIRMPTEDGGLLPLLFSPTTMRAPSAKSPPSTSVLRLSVMPSCTLTGCNSWPLST
jgi:hypothetical protein